MKGAIGLLIAVFVCCVASTVVDVRPPSGGILIPPQRTGQCSWQACVTDKSTCFCMPSLIGVPQIKCNPVKNPRQDVFPKCIDVMLG